MSDELIQERNELLERVGQLEFLLDIERYNHRSDNESLLKEAKVPRGSSGKLYRVIRFCANPECGRRLEFDDCYACGTDDAPTIDYYHAQDDYWQLRNALERIAAGPRPDGTYNLSREACEQIARDVFHGS